MTALRSPVQTLTVETTLVTGIRHLIPLLDATRPLLWMRGGDGFAGIGSAVRLEFSGPTRMTDAGLAWSELAAAAQIVDPVAVPGSGLVAFGSFAFSASSGAVSVLIVPEMIIGRRDGRSWVTRIRVADADAESDVVRSDVAGSDIAGSDVAGSELAAETDADSPAAANTSAMSGSGVPRPRPLGDELGVAFRAGSMSKDAYRAAVEAATDRIRLGELGKVVLARDRVGVVPEGSDLRRPLTRLADNYSDCWTFAVDGLIGSSPETLVRVNHGTVDARVLAGTIKRGPDAEADQGKADTLAASSKDLQEHQFAVQSVLDALRPHSARLSVSASPFTLKLPNLWHLATDVDGLLSDESTSLDLINALHPTAAVAGTPTPEALALIDELEPFDRGRYAGPVGWVGADGDGEWAVALRCAHVSTDGAITAYAGCGIVDGSSAKRELAETRMKFRPIMDAFAVPYP